MEVSDDKFNKCISTMASLVHRFDFEPLCVGGAQQSHLVVCDRVYCHTGTQRGISDPEGIQVVSKKINLRNCFFFLRLDL